MKKVIYLTIDEEMFLKQIFTFILFILFLQHQLSMIFV